MCRKRNAPWHGHLAVHQGTRPFAQYVLTTGRRLHLKRSADSGETGCRTLPSTLPNRAIVCRNMTAAQLANQLPNIAGDYFMDNPIADQTNLEGAWDFELNWTGRGGLATAGASGASIFAALENQLGLRVVVRNVPAPVIVVDSVQQNPGPNPSGISRAMGVPKAEFEVATIKPSVPQTGERSFRIEGSLVTLRGFTLRALIKFAWGLQDMDVIDNDDLLAPTPQISGSERFDIVARRPASIHGGSGDLEAIHEALRALLAERFKLVTHTENRPVSVYAVTASKPKLRKADPSARSGCRNSLLKPATNLAGTPIFSVSCQNTTMAQLSEKLQPWAGAYIRHPVIDVTGLDGGWDFIVQWSPPHLVSPATSDAEGAAREPNGDLTLIEALDRQLGLKLRQEKRSVPVLIVDRIESRPLEN
ncbi:MAG: TIGR03435 family protein [Edaphobacter sp.]